MNETNEYKEKMIQELGKFINVYNSIANTSYLFDIEKGDYDHFIRILGNYMHKIYSKDGWRNTKLIFADDIFIDFSSFVNTEYEEKVDNYLQSLHHAFLDSLDNEVEQYLETTKDYNDNEKQICREFYGKISVLHAKMKENIFSSTDTIITSQENISTYKTELEEYNRYMNYIASNQSLYSLIKHFDEKIRHLAKTKTPIKILFDV